jgi:hypothetical protein
MIKIGDIYYLEYYSQEGDKLFFKGIVKQVHRSVVEVIKSYDGIWKDWESFLFNPDRGFKNIKYEIYNKKNNPEYFI